MRWSVWVFALAPVFAWACGVLVEYMSGSQWSQMLDKGGYGDPDLSIVIPS